jgi:hypothetical protein
MCDRLHLQRIGCDRLRNIRAEHPHHRHRVAGLLRVFCAQAATKPLKLSGSYLTARLAGAGQPPRKPLQRKCGGASAPPASIPIRCPRSAWEKFIALEAMHDPRDLQWPGASRINCPERSSSRTYAHWQIAICGAPCGQTSYFCYVIRGRRAAWLAQRAT